jgi:hypothetical protein
MSRHARKRAPGLEDLQRPPGAGKGPFRVSPDVLAAVQEWREKVDPALAGLTLLSRIW